MFDIKKRSWFFFVCNIWGGGKWGGDARSGLEGKEEKEKGARERLYQPKTDLCV